jgi:hypothetical protein
MVRQLVGWLERLRVLGELLRELSKLKQCRTGASTTDPVHDVQGEIGDLEDGRISVGGGGWRSPQHFHLPPEGIQILTVAFQCHCLRAHCQRASLARTE